MNKYLVVDLLPSEWNKVTQWLLIPLSKPLPGSNKLSRDLLEDRISTALRKPLNSQTSITDSSNALEVLYQHISQPSMLEVSTETDQVILEPAQQFLSDFVPVPEHDESHRAQIESLSKEIVELKHISEAKDAQIAANSLLIQELQGKIQVLEASTKPQKLESVPSAVAENRLVKLPEYREDVLSRLLRVSKVSNKLVSYLSNDTSSILAICSVSKSCRMLLSLHSLPLKTILEAKTTALKREIEALKRAANRLQDLTTPAGSDMNEYVQFLLFKYLQKQVKPAQVLEPTLMKSQQLINTINDETSSALFSESNGKPFDLEDEQDNIEKLKVLTLKQIENVLARQVYNKGEAPESILRMKKESYDKVEAGVTKGPQEGANNDDDVQSET